MAKEKVAVVGAGITGVAAASVVGALGHDVTVYESNRAPGGLIRCEVVEGNLFHKVGGHIFNAKDADVSEWFWGHFDKEKEFLKAERNARILLNGQVVGYPLENHLYQLDQLRLKSIVSELLQLQAKGYRDPYSYPDFASFLKGNFGETLYQLYFLPYNTKIWQTDLASVPMEWLEGKLPMPDFNKIFTDNISRAGEKEMVHSTFYYPRVGGSQFIIDRLSRDLNIRSQSAVTSIEYKNGKWIIGGTSYDRVVYTGDIRQLTKILQIDNKRVQEALTHVKTLKSNGTSNILCETDDTDLSWLYLPSAEIRAHRIIYTGNFSSSNNAPGKRKSCVVEFSGKVGREEMVKELPLLPGNLKPIATNYEPNSYVVHDKDTSSKITDVKEQLLPLNFYLRGRFAEWQYYNMDKAIESTFSLRKYL